MIECAEQYPYGIATRGHNNLPAHCLRNAEMDTGNIGIATYTVLRVAGKVSQ